MAVKVIGDWGLHEGAKEGQGDYQVVEKVHRFHAYVEVLVAGERKTNLQQLHFCKAFHLI